ncbi:MAG TPA: PAS domain S-box protein [Candidatus Sulfotelmatobacter sp.]|nr:PAS domain S-box protein [Candidatus Sulfotelmatobacter sp.]
MPPSGKPAGNNPSANSPAVTSEVNYSPDAVATVPLDHNSEVNKELRRLNRALRALSACNQALAQATSEMELLNQICQIIVQVGGYRMAGIGFAEQDEQKTLRPVAHAGYDSGYFDQIQLSWADIPAGRGPAGTAVRDNRICVVTDTEHDPTFGLWREAASTRGYASVTCLPLRESGVPFGVLAIYSDQANSFEKSEVELLTEMANNLAFGIVALRSQEETRRATQALLQAEAKYRQLVEEVPAISYVAQTGALGPFLYMSPQVETILGYSPDVCMKDPHFWWNHLHPDDRALAKQEDNWEDGRLFQVEYRMMREDGRQVWIRDEAIVVLDPQTGKRLTRGVLIDISEQKRAEEALRRSEESYRMFVAQSSEGIFREELDFPLPINLPEDQVVLRMLHESYMAECNEAMAKMYALNSPQEFLGKRPTKLSNSDDPHSVDLTREYVRNGFRLVDRVSHEKDAKGNPKVFLISMFGVVEDGKLLHTWGIQRDITERLKAEEARQKAEDALRESEERYRAFVAQSSEGIYRMEYVPPIPCHLSIREQIAQGFEVGILAECNDAMAKMYGRESARELSGQKLGDFLVLRDPLTMKFMGDFIQGGYRISDQESIEVDAQGQKRIFRNTMVGTIVDGHWVRTWGITRDVTERIHLEEQLRNAQQLEAIGRLAGGIAHDFNNILSIIMGHGELLLATAKLDEDGRNGVEQIKRAADRAAQLTQQLLAFSRKQVLQPRVLDLNETVAALQKMLTRVIGEDIELIANLSPSLMTVRADPGQVEQVLMNLAVNARDAMPQGGKIMMETFHADLSADEARELDLPAGRYVVLKVIDTGHGMDAATLSHIFEPFFTTKARGKGTGLGLAMVYGIVKQSGGGIQVESDSGRGTGFRIYLPAVEGDTGTQAALSRIQEIEGGVETILIAEDEPDLRELTRIFLEGYGYRVLEAGSADEALQVAERFPAKIHLLLTDVIMPGMSGRQLAEKILGKRSETKIVYMTGYTDDMVVQHKVLEPGVQLLQKPFTKVELGQKVRAILDTA